MLALPPYLPEIQMLDHRCFLAHAEEVVYIIVATVRRCGIPTEWFAIAG